MNRIANSFGALFLGLIAMAAAGNALRAAAESPRPATPPVAEARQSASNSLQRVDYAVLPANRIVIKLTFRNEIKERPAITVGYHPAANLMLDLADTASELSIDRIEIGHRDARNLQVIAAGNRTRVIINLNRPLSYEIAVTGREVLLTLQRNSDVTR